MDYCGYVVESNKPGRRKGPREGWILGTGLKNETIVYKRYAELFPEISLTMENIEMANNIPVSMKVIVHPFLRIFPYPYVGIFGTINSGEIYNPINCISATLTYFDEHVSFAPPYFIYIFASYGNLFVLSTIVYYYVLHRDHAYYFQ